MTTYSSYTDRELIALLKQGDERAIGAFFEHHQQLIFGVLRLQKTGKELEAILRSIDIMPLVG